MIRTTRHCSALLPFVYLGGGETAAAQKLSDVSIVVVQTLPPKPPSQGVIGAAHP